jgi:hypothetical protein
MNRFLRTVIVAFMALGMVAAVANAQAKKLKESDLPEPVKATAAQVSESGRVIGYWEREQDGGIVYEVDVVVDGRGKGVLISPTGEIIVIQAEISWDELDPNVQAGLKQKAGDGKIVKVDSVTRSGKVQRYIAVVDHDGKKSKVEVGPDGAPPVLEGAAEHQ